MSASAIIIRVEKGPQGRSRGSTGIFGGWSQDELNELAELLTGQKPLEPVVPEDIDEMLSKGQPPYEPPRSSPKMRLLTKLRAL